MIGAHQRKTELPKVNPAWVEAGGESETEMTLSIDVCVNDKMKARFQSYLIYQLEAQEECHRHYSKCIRHTVNGIVTPELVAEFGSFILHLAGYTEREIAFDRSAKLKEPPRHGGWKQKEERSV